MPGALSRYNGLLQRIFKGDVIVYALLQLLHILLHLRLFFFPFIKSSDYLIQKGIHFPLFISAEHH